MRKTNSLIFTKAFLFFLSLVLFSLFFLFSGAWRKTASACNTNCAASRSCAPPDCDDCQWCSESQIPMPDIHNPFLPKTLTDLPATTFFQKALSTGVTLGFIIGIIVFIFVLLIGAVRWITSGGDKSGAETAQKTITSALIGLAILLSIFAIIQLIEFFFDISITKFSLPTL